MPIYRLQAPESGIPSPSGEDITGTLILGIFSSAPGIKAIQYNQGDYDIFYPYPGAEVWCRLHVMGSELAHIAIFRHFVYATEPIPGNKFKDPEHGYPAYACAHIGDVDIQPDNPPLLLSAADALHGFIFYSSGTPPLPWAQID